MRWERWVEPIKIAPRQEGEENRLPTPLADKNPIQQTKTSSQDPVSSETVLPLKLKDFSYSSEVPSIGTHVQKKLGINIPTQEGKNSRDFLLKKPSELTENEWESLKFGVFFRGLPEKNFLEKVSAKLEHSR